MDIPIDFTELTQLTSLGVQPQSLDFRSTTLESDKYVCIRESTPQGNSVAIVELATNQVTRKNMSADNAIMNPSQMVISLRANGTTLQIFNLESKQRLKSFTMQEPVIFWKWLNDKVLGLVTASSIFIWNIFDGTPQGPTKLTDKHSSLQSCQMINLVANKSLTWFAATGIAQEDGRIVGHIQLYSKKRNISQAIEGHVCRFAQLKLEGSSVETQIFVCGNRTATGGQMHLIEIDHAEGAPEFHKKTVDIFFPADATNDFPVSCQVSEKYGIVYLLTKYGFIHLYELESGANLFVNRISADPIFTVAPHKEGVVAINRSGQVLAVEVATDKIVPYILTKLSNATLALTVASRGLPGGEQLFSQHFSQSLMNGDYAGAARIAASCANLRTPDTINKLKNIQAGPGQISPILQYFSILLDKGTLNKYESIELARPVLQQERKPLLEKWLKEDKLECSDELGDIIRPFDVQLALAVYMRAGQSPAKVVECLAGLGQYDKILAYCEKVGYSPNYAILVQNILRVNPDAAAEFAAQLAVQSPESVESLADVFFSQNYLQQGTAFLLEALKEDSPSQGNLQTKLLESNLVHAPQVADAILGNAMFSHYDKPAIAALCEKAGLYQRALEHYEDLSDIKRVIVHTEAIPTDWLVAYFGKLNVEQSVVCVRQLLASWQESQNQVTLQVIVQVSTKYSELIGPMTLVKLYDEFKCNDGCYYFLGAIVNTTNDGDVVFKYIQCAAALNQTKEIERVVRDNNIYPAEKVKNFLKEADLSDQLPLMVVCDRFGYVHDLVLFLYKKKLFKFIEVYVQQVNPANAGPVVGALLDVDCDESVIKGLLKTLVGRTSIGPLCDEAEKRNRLKVLLPFLEESLQAAPAGDTIIYNALAKIYIDSNNNPEKFLAENDNYDTLVVGHYCEKRDPYLAFTAYSKGQNDAELIAVTNENGMFKQQARYILNRSDLQLYAEVLQESNSHRRQLVDHLVGTAIPEIEDPQPVSVAVKALMEADMPTELVELLEKIILEPSPFTDNPSLQGLLILTAVKADPSRVAGYIEKLEEYDPTEIAPLVCEAGLYEEAFSIYDKFSLKSDALKVLLEEITSLDRGQEYAEKNDSAELWSQLAAAQLNGLRISEALDSYIRARDPLEFAHVISIAEEAERYDELIKYLVMARECGLREPSVDGALILSYAATNRLSEVSLFLQQNNVADLNEVGDALYKRQQYEGARYVYEAGSNHAKLASTLVHLNNLQAAVDCARRASSTSVWRQVSEACIDRHEFSLAQICGLNLIVHAEELNDLVAKYEYHGYFDQLLSLFEAGLGMERAHMGMFTQLTILYTKYAPERVMEHLRLFWSRINIPKCVAACEESHLWPELVFLFSHYDEWDNAALAMMEHFESAFDHNSFKEIVVKVSNLEIYYKAINFYLNTRPVLLTDLLSVLIPRLDLPRAVRIFSKSDNLPLVKPFLFSVLERNNSVVNAAYHDLLIEEEDYKALRSAVEAHDKFDALDLAQRLEHHSLIFFRQIAALLYRKNSKWNKAIAILKNDRLWSDVVETAALSNSQNVAHDTMEYFVETGNKECFVAMLYACYSFVSFDYVLELTWVHSLADYTKPYEISVAKENHQRLNEVYADMKKRQERQEQEKPVQAEPLMITNGAPMSVQPTGFGFGN